MTLRRRKMSTIWEAAAPRDTCADDEERLEEKRSKQAGWLAALEAPRTRWKKYEKDTAAYEIW